MLESIHKFGKEISDELAHAWDSLSEGWRELLTHSSNALTRFAHKEKRSAAATSPAAPLWGLVSSDVIDMEDAIVVRLELPGVAKEDCEIVVDDTTLYIQGEKHYDHEHLGGSFHLRQCAYGSFQRAIVLPHNVDAGHASAKFKDGVLIITLPKTLSIEPRRITVK
ncbi:MAG: Hsp20/alpha crystallin family protein [Burkholderiales bacterium]